MPLVAHAQMYRCEAEGGRKTYSDLPCGEKAVMVDVRPSSGSTSVGPSAAMRVQHYPIKGTTSDALVAEIRRKGPDGWWGNAHTRVTYEMTMRESRGSCEVASVQAFADSTVRLPLWVNRYEAPAAIQAHFDTEFRSLEYHERGHVQISIEGAKALERALRGIGPQRSCEVLKREAQWRYGELQRIVQEQQVRYDMDTNHGLLQSPYR